MNAKSGRTLFAAGLITAALASGAIGQQDDKLGKVTFPTSCDPDVQAEFDRGVAMLHSYWFLIARRKFEEILKQDPTCAMAYWGVAMDFLGNTLAATPSRADAQAAWDALEKARAAGPKTQRERDWIEALSAYFRDHDKVAVNARLAAYNAAMERMAQSYPDDYEVQAFYALALQAAAPKSDLSYANQIKSADVVGKTLRTEPAASGCDALPDSCLRLRAACREGNRVSAALCRYCACRAARAAHAVAHLLHGRTLGRIHCLERVVA